MPIQYRVQAKVVDLRGDTPKPSDRFFVDTNVWFWTVYARLGLSPSAPSPNRVAVYPAYLKAALLAGAGLFWSGLSLSELAHRIEQTELEIFCQTSQQPSLKPKEFRHNFPGERLRVTQEIQAAWQDVETMAQPLSNSPIIDAKATTAALQTFASHALDGYDVFALQAVVASGIQQVLTDDGDFCVVPNITLFTANRTVVAAAQAQGKLVVR